jgi:NAD(P)-dependent dehydrogenase (short-subunit alcohol dehydrogenase family)
MVAVVIEVYGRLDCAVNNAAIPPDSALIVDATEADFDRIIAVNLKSVFLCDKYEIAQMLRQGGGGSIVNIASTSGIRVQPMTVAYNAAKHGVIGITKTAAMEYAEHGIRVNAVCPGAIKTQLLATALEETGKKEEDVIPYYSLLGRLGEPEEVAQASVWLCSDLASYTTGGSLWADGGYLSR